MNAAQKYKIYESAPFTKVFKYYTDKILTESYTKLGDYIEKIQTGKTPSKTIPEYYNSEDIDWFKPNEIGLRKQVLASNNKISNTALLDKKATIYQGETLLINCIGDIGRIAILKHTASSNQQITGLNFNNDVLIEYIYYYLLSHREIFYKEASSTTLLIINQKKIKNLPVKIPSIQKQKQIVELINKLSLDFEERIKPNVDLLNIDLELKNVIKRVFTVYYSQKEFININKDELDNLAKLRQSILQDAVRGKLTQEWRANLIEPIESASELLKKIKAKKEELLKNKIVRKGKKQDSIENFEIKTDIHDEWEYVDLDDICQYITDGTHQTPTYVKKGRIFLSAQNVKPFKFMPDKHKFVSEVAYQGYINNRKPEKGDLLLGRVGAGIGETAVIDQDIEFAIYVSLGLVKTFKKLTNPNYLAIVFNSPYGVNYAKGNVSSKGTSAGNFNLGRIRSFKIPFPPLEEQNVIVEKVSQLLNYCDTLEREIQTSKEHAELLMQSVLSELLGEENSFVTQNITKEKEKKEAPKRAIVYDSTTTYMKLVALLQKHGRLHAEDLWKMSEFPNDDEIDKFYAELKKQIEVEKQLKKVAKKAF